jgi:hypothetical protein
MNDVTNATRSGSRPAKAGRLHHARAGAGVRQWHRDGSIGDVRPPIAQQSGKNRCGHCADIWRGEMPYKHDLFWEVVEAISHVDDAQEAFELACMASARLGWDTTQVWSTNRHAKRAFEIRWLHLPDRRVSGGDLRWSRDSAA